MKNWKVAEAKQQFSDVVRRAASKPQLIYNRDRLVAAVVDPQTFLAFQEWQQSSRQQSLSEAFQTLRDIAKEERYKLSTGRRRNRRNPLIGVLEDVSG